MSFNNIQKRPLYCLNFERHVLAFMHEHKLFLKGKKMLVSVSGGVDSLCLAEVLWRLNFPIELLHFNHGTRPQENSKEEALVIKFAKERSLPTHTVALSMSLDEKNFEKKARLERRRAYKDFIARDYWVYTAHHIDDSFEWSLMQSFKQSGLRSSLGIPVFNRGVVRPFMCVTKKQILHYARIARISWYEDSSNLNLKFERNHLRHVIVKNILQKYPKALAHYVARSNELIKIKTLPFKKRNEKWGIVFTHQNLSLVKEEIIEAIQELSDKERGILAQEVEKLVKAQKEIMNDPKNFPFKGPFSFSGNVKGHLIYDELLLMNREQQLLFQKLDQLIVSYLENITQIPASLYIDVFPYVLISFKCNLKKSSKFIHPLLPVTCKWLKNQNISYVFTPLLTPLNKQKLAFDAVILDSSILGL